MSTEDNAPADKEMGSGAGEYANLGAEKVALPPAPDFLREQATAVTDPNLRALVERFAASHGERIWQGEDAPDTVIPSGTFPGLESKIPGKSESLAREEITWVIKLAGEYIAEPTGSRGSSTLVDLRQGDAFDQAIGEEVMALFGATGREHGGPEADKLQPERFETRTYLTDLPGYVLKRWRHHRSAPTLQGDGTDFEKFYIQRMD